jgi:homoserine kinase
VPDFKVDTKDARAVLPKTVSREDAIFNMQRIALLPYAFEHGKLDLIPLVTDDKLHESYRRSLYRNIDEVEKCAFDLGAVSFTVSGAGPTCLCYSVEPIYSRLNENISRLENGWRAYGLAVDNEGAKEIYDEQ